MGKRLLKRLEGIAEPDEDVILGASRPPNPDEVIAEGCVKLPGLEGVSRDPRGSYPNFSVRGAGVNSVTVLGRVLQDPVITLYHGLGEVTRSDVLDATYVLAIPKCYFSDSDKAYIPIPVRARSTQAIVVAKYIRKGFMVHFQGAISYKSSSIEFWASQQIVTYAFGNIEPLPLYHARRRSVAQIKMKEILRMHNRDAFSDLHLEDEDEFALEDGIPLGEQTLYEEGYFKDDEKDDDYDT